MIRRRIFRMIILVSVLLVLAVLTLSFKEIHLPGLDRDGTGPLGLRLGLDLEGGSSLKYQADFPEEIDLDFGVVDRDVLGSVARFLGVSVTQLTIEDNRFTVQVPGPPAEDPSDVQLALERIAPVSNIFLVPTGEVPPLYDVTFDVSDGEEDVEIDDIFTALATHVGALVNPLGGNTFSIQVPGLGEGNLDELRLILGDLTAIGELTLASPDGSSGEATVTFATVGRDTLLAALARSAGASVESSGSNRFVLSIPGLKAGQINEFQNSLERVAPLLPGTTPDLITSGDAEVGQIRVEYALPVDGTTVTDDRILAGVAVNLGARIKDSEDSRFTIEIRGVDSEEIKVQLAERVAPITDFQTRQREATAEDMKGVVNIIQRRINALGTTEPIVQRLGSNKVWVQIPGIEDLEEAKSLIRNAAQLVIRDRFCTNPSAALGGPCTEFTEEEIGGGLTGDDVSDAFADRDAAGLPAVSIRFNSRGTRLFADLTREIAGNQTRRIAMYLDNVLLLAPTARAFIPNGQTIITGRFSTEETRNLAIQLRSGAIPVPLRIVSETTVDATLGKDSLRDSVKAGIIGLALVFGFIVAYYRAPGLVAGTSLLIYAVLVLAIFKLVPVTLTLSGIAGLILSIGIAVDANVLIFERVKEELRAGRTLSSSMEVGFRRAWTAIFDGNVSTLITCAILWWLGSRLGAPQVTGFALTLGIGVAVSMFTAVAVSRNLLQVMSLTRIGANINLFTPEGLRRPAGVAGGDR